MTAETPLVDEDAIRACVDLVGRTGAVHFEIGYLNDGVPVDQAAWWAHAQYRGARISVDSYRGPVEAAEALARKLLTGARCAHCRGLVALSSQGAVAFGLTNMADGSTWTAEEAARTEQCHWVRRGDRWIRGCESRAEEATAGE